MTPLPAESIAERVAAWALSVDPVVVPAVVRETAAKVVLDIVGNCIAARERDYVGSLIAAWDGEGPCTALGHRRGLDAAGAALVNGAAAHGEDFDDTFEGSPVHAGCVIVPAVLACCEGQGRNGSAALAGIAVGLELMCRLALVAPTAIHRAGFHPSAVLGPLGAAAAIGTALGVPKPVLVNALGIAGSMASGIIEYLAEGTWTKRLHPGWAAQSGLRAVAMARHGFTGPRTVFEGTHGFFAAFADPVVPRDYSHLTDGLGDDWYMRRIAFKPYACGTMAQPYIDCAIALKARGVAAADIVAIECPTSEGIVHRLWEPLDEKRRPTTPYSAKFSIPYCVAVGFIDGKAGLAEFSEARIGDSNVLDLAARVGYVVDPANEYPRNYTGHLKARLKDRSVQTVDQPHLRGGVHEPMTLAELARKFHDNALFGGWDEGRIDTLRRFCETLFERDSLGELSRLRD